VAVAGDGPFEPQTAGPHRIRHRRPDEARPGRVRPERRAVVVASCMPPLGSDRRQWRRRLLRASNSWLNSHCPQLTHD
jgi:hypothetical protein